MVRGFAAASRIRSASTLPETMPSFPMDHSVRELPRVGTPLAMAWRKRPRCLGSAAVFGALRETPPR